MRDALIATILSPREQ